ncbi:unnamed protein product, partial [Rotaria sordida]
MMNPYVPNHVLEISNPQLHAIDDLDEYFIDSLAMACRSRTTYLDCIRQHPLPKTIDPIIVKTITIPTNIGNPCLS